MVDQHCWIADQSAQQTRRLADRCSAELEVPEASVLQRGEMRAVGCEEGVKRHCEDVDYGRAGFAGPVEIRHSGYYGGSVFEVGDALGGE